jgi:hypothetical protein
MRAEDSKARLGGLFGLAGAAKRASTRNRERHVPEISIFGNELDSNVILAIARATNVDHAALNGARGMVVHEQELLTHGDEMLEIKKRAVAIHGLRVRVDDKLFALARFAMHGQRHSQGDANGATTFLVTKID